MPELTDAISQFVPPGDDEKKYKALTLVVAIFLLGAGMSMIQPIISDGYDPGSGDLETVVIAVIFILVGAMLGFVREYQVKGMTAKKVLKTKKKAAKKDVKKEPVKEEEE